MDDLKKGKIFYVEDDKFLSDLLKAKLQSSGYNIEFYEDGQTAHAAVESSQADIFVIDLLLPHIDGFEIVKKIKESERHKGKQVWVFSNYGDQENIDRAFSLGADKFLTKSSFVPDELVAEIDSILVEGTTSESQ